MKKENLAKKFGPFFESIKSVISLEDSVDVISSVDNAIGKRLLKQNEDSKEIFGNSMGSFLKDLESKFPKEKEQEIIVPFRMAMKDASTTNVKHMIDFGAEKIGEKSNNPSLCSKALSPLNFGSFGSDDAGEDKGLMSDLQMFDFGMQTR